MLFIELDGRGPRYAQIVRALLAAMAAGTIRPGERLPPSRALARQLRCARNVVLDAYERLLMEGYVVSRSRTGTFVSSELPQAQAVPTAKPHVRRRARLKLLAPAGRRLAEEAERARAIGDPPRRFGIDFTPRASDPDLLIVNHLKRTFRKVLREPTVFGYGDPAGDEGLRSEIARRLRGVRGIVRSADQIVITSGARQAVDICARLLLRDGDRVLMEDPGYEAARAAFRAAGATVVPISVGANGLDPATRLESLPAARLVYVTPSHQFPTGGVLSDPQRQQLLAWARARRAFLLEDDYDGELRHAPPGIKALAGEQSDTHVIYCGSFAKSLFASLRLGYLALPDALVGAVVNAKWLTDRASSTLLQLLVRDLMASGEYDRHVRRMQRRYATRRHALTSALEQQLGPEVVIGGDAGGAHLVAWLPELAGRDVDALVVACRRRDVGVATVAQHAMHVMNSGGLVLGYGLLDERAIEAGVSRIAAAYRSLRARGAGRPQSRHSA